MEGIFEKKEAAPRTFEEVVKEGISHALETIKFRYVDTDTRSKLDGHNVEHTQNVVRRVREILTAIRTSDPSLVTEREIALGGLLASHHDIRMEDDIEEEPDTEVRYIKQKRKRKKGISELKSAEVMLEFMDLPTNRTLFTDEEREIVKDVILHTVPTFDPKLKTVVQERLNEDSRILARALALADLGDAGMGGSEEYRKQGDGFFREENYDITKALRDKQPINSELALYFKSRMLKWGREQVEFATGRKERFESEIAGLPENAKKALRDIFCKFDESIKGAEETLDKRAVMSFPEIAEDMGYDVSHLP